jgi:hypothetical protein
VLIPLDAEYVQAVPYLITWLHNNPDVLIQSLRREGSFEKARFLAGASCLHYLDSFPHWSGWVMQCMFT